MFKVCCASLSGIDSDKVKHRHRPRRADSESGEINEEDMSRVETVRKWTEGSEGGCEGRLGKINMTVQRRGWGGSRGSMEEEEKKSESEKRRMMMRKRECRKSELMFADKGKK